MANRRQVPGDFQPGDKVRIRSGPHAGARGVYHGQVDGRVEIEKADDGVILVEADAVTNYSLAARRAWEVMPKRAGRPPIDPTRRKKMVSMRLDPDIWARLGEAVELGLIASREEAVNNWVEDRLDRLFELKNDEYREGHNAT